MNQLDVSVRLAFALARFARYMSIAIHILVTFMVFSMFGWFWGILSFFLPYVAVPVVAVMLIFQEGVFNVLIMLIIATIVCHCLSFVMARGIFREIRSNS